MLLALPRLQVPILDRHFDRRGCLRAGWRQSGQLTLRLKDFKVVILRRGLRTLRARIQTAVPQAMLKANPNVRLAAMLFSNE